MRGSLAHEPRVFFCSFTLENVSEALPRALPTYFLS